jgi:hypothetical protein
MDKLTAWRTQSLGTRFDFAFSCSVYSQRVLTAGGLRKEENVPQLSAGRAGYGLRTSLFRETGREEHWLQANMDCCGVTSDPMRLPADFAHFTFLRG